MRSRYKKSLIIYSSILGALALIFLIYIFITLITYENHQINNYLINTINNLSDQELSNYLSEYNLASDLLEQYQEITSKKDLEVKKIADEEYEIYDGNRQIFTITTKVLKNKTKLGLFTYQEREVVDIIPNLSRGLFYYDVIIPSNYKLYLDGEEITDYSKSSNFIDLDFMYYNSSMPSLVTYEINNLTSEKEIVVKDFKGKTIDIAEEDFVYQNPDYFYQTNTLEEAKEYIDINIDIMEVAHNWHLFLTKDLSGANYGFNTIAAYLIDGTNMYQMAYNWAHSVDITFTSKHTLGNPIWPEERLENFEIYGDAAFSCEVYLNKDMIVAGKHQSDIMHDRLYFIKDNNEWKLINIQGIE